jgi:hypothetical protein
VPTTTPILATRFNNLQSRIAAIYGPPSSASSATGYGQTVRSGQVESFDATSRTFNASTNVDYSSNRITISGHNFAEGGLVEYDANGNDPIVETLIEDAHYYVKVISSNVIELYFEYDGTTFSREVDLLSGASGTHILNYYNTDKISADDYFQLYVDVATARIHQIGNGFIVGNSAFIAAGDIIELSYLTFMEGVMTQIEADKFLIADPGQVILESLKDGSNSSIDSVRTSPWNGTRRHEFSLNFTSTAQARGFWNSAGEIRINPSLTGGSGQKTGDWRSIIGDTNGIGYLTFSRTGTAKTGPGGSITSSITPYNLTSSYQVVMQINGASYGNNRYRLYARKVSNTEYRFRLEFADLDSPGGFGIDENVNGTLRSNIQIYRPNGNVVIGGTSYNTVSFTATGQNIQTL